MLRVLGSSTRALAVALRAEGRRFSGTAPSTRKRGGSAGAMAGPVSSVNFKAQVEKVLNQLHTAIEVGTMPLNTDFKLSRIVSAEQQSVTLDAGEKGFYIFSVDWAGEMLTVQTPISGVRQYAYEPESDTWLNSIDGHDMRGLVTRDLLRHSRGCPKF